MYTVASLFTGIGGFDLGFGGEVRVHESSVANPTDVASPRDPHGFVGLRRLGFRVVFRNDCCPVAARLAVANAPGPYVIGDIRTLLSSPETRPPTTDVVIGGFPCQDFSQAGARRGLQSERGQLYRSFVDVVQQGRPKVFAAENVPGLLNTEGALERIVADFTALGYHVAHQLIRCEDHGVPQRRHRVVIMGLRADLATPGPGWNLIDHNRCGATVEQVLAHLDEPEHTADPAQRVYSRNRRRPRSPYDWAIDPTGVSPTLRAHHHGNIQFRRTGAGERRLTLREVALLQTFPPAFRLTDPPRQSKRAVPDAKRRRGVAVLWGAAKAYVPLGNAVPPLLGWLVAHKVESLLQGLTSGGRTMCGSAE